MNLYWLDQSDSEVPFGDAWLSASERVWQASLRIQKRRDDWRLGRWTAKRTITAMLDHLRAEDIEIRTAASGAPLVFVRYQPQNLTISISHRAGRGCCAAVPERASLGCDVELVEPRSPGFVEDYFTEGERRLIAQTESVWRDTAITLLWSAKESALKALRVGLKEDTRSVDVTSSPLNEPRSNSWTALKVRHWAGELEGWWRVDGRFVRTVVSCPRGPAPLSLAPRWVHKER